MKRINTHDGLFHNPDQFNSGTVIDATWLNALQEEIAQTIEYFGGTVDPTVSNQLAKTIESVFRNGSGTIDCGIIG